MLTLFRLILFGSVFIYVGLSGAKAQTVYIANNNPLAVGGTNVFTGATALTDAIAATSNGDIVYVVPSGTSYGDIGAISTEISIFGAGLNPDQTTPDNSTIQQVVIGASNVRLSGLVINRDPTDGSAISFGGTFANITIDNCRFSRLTAGSDLSNLLLMNNIMGEDIGGFGRGTVVVTTGTSGLRLTNNIIYGSSQGGANSSAWMHDFNGAIVEHNVFIGNTSGSTQSAFFVATNNSFKNNIFYGLRLRTTAGSFANNTFEYNISFGASNNTFPTADGNVSLNNLENVDPIFVNISFGNSFDFSQDPNLQAGSPGLGTGEGGTDRGVFGGATPLDFTFTSLPTVQSVNIPAAVAQGDDLSINIKGNGN